MQDPVLAIILAGTLKPQPLREQTGLPILCLPLTGERTLLGVWLKAIETLPGPREVRIVVSGEMDVPVLTAACGPIGGSRRVVVEPSSWRGTAGVVRDVAAQAQPQTLVVVIEGNMLPPRSLSPLVEPVRGEVIGAVGAVGSQPYGVYCFRRSALEEIPHIGYCDLKEQFLPALNGRGRLVRAAAFDDAFLRVSDRKSYLLATRKCVEWGGSSPAPLARPGVRFHGHCLVSSEAAIGDGAVIHDSVVMPGARIGRDAIVSRSLVIPGAHVADGARLTREVAAPIHAGANGLAHRSAYARRRQA